KRVEWTLERIDEPLPRARAHTRLPAHVSSRAARQGRRHCRGRRLGAARSVTNTATHGGAVAARAQFVRRGCRPRRGGEGDRTMGFTGDRMTSTVVAGRGTAADVASVDEIRRQFPALERIHNARPVAYFDGPGGTQVPRSVVDAMADYLFHHNANTHWLYPTSEETDALLLRARERFADFFNASADEIAFGQNMTTLTFHLARGLGREWAAGDEIVVTELDHHGNVAPWRALANERAVTVRTVKMNTADGRLDWRDLERQIGGKTRLLAVGAASNALGTITDMRGAAELAHAAGALVFVDAVHLAPHELIAVAALK